MTPAVLPILVTGMVYGLSAGIAPGPLLTLVIAETLTHSAREGVKVALAPMITDLPIIVAALALVHGLSGFEIVLGCVSVCGGLYLCHLGLESIRFRGVAAGAEKPRPRSLRKGVVTNFLSPHPYLFWISVGGPALLTASRGGLLGPALFLGAFYAFLVGSKMGVALAAGRFQAVLRSRAYTAVMVFLGMALLLFAVLLLRDGAGLIMKGLAKV